MSTVSIKRLVAAVIAVAVLAAPLPALATVNPDATSAAAAGIQYLANNQASDGSITGFSGVSDWSTEAITAGGQQASSFVHGGSASLLSFLQADTPTASTTPTALERKIIAIAATGQDAANFGGIDYLAQLEAQHTDGQIGDPTLLNDDIFGIIAIDGAQADSLQSAAQDALNYLLAHQSADGGFSYTTETCGFNFDNPNDNPLTDPCDYTIGSDTNDTASAIIAMNAAEHLGLVSAGLTTARSSALQYLASTQNADGGFGYDGFSDSDGSSTAWCLMALNAAGDAASSSAGQARAWLLNDQNPDGGFSYGAYGTTESDTSTTAHVVTALLGSTWLLRPTPSAIPQSTTGTSMPPTATTATPPTAVSATSQPAAAVSTTGSSDGTDQAAPVTTDLVDQSQTPQVKGAATRSADKSTSPATPKTTKASSHYAVYGGVVLVLVAITWFVLESRHSKGVN